MADNNATATWERIARFYHTTRKAVHILVAFSADAAAASLTLSGLFKASLIPFNLHPITVYSEVSDIIAKTNIAQDFARVSESDELVDDLFFLVGLGAPVVLSELFDFTRHIVVVLDAYRPVHLRNLREEDDTRLFIWNHTRTRDAVDAFFAREQRAEATRRRRRRRKTDLARRRRLQRQYDDDDDANVSSEELNDSSEGESDDSSESSLDEELTESADSTPQASQDRVDWMSDDADAVPPHMLALYNASVCGGRSCAAEAYELSVLLNRFRDIYLWHAAVGVCDLLRRGLIDYGTYLVEMRPLQDAVTLHKSIRRGALEELTEEAVNQYRRAATNRLLLANNEEAQLLLLRHTSLWNALWYHPVTASVLGLHHEEDGEGFVRQLLARCGVSVKVAQQPWRGIPRERAEEALRLVQAELRHIFERRGSFVSTPNQVPCITRAMGFSTEVSTVDVCTLFEAILAAVPDHTVLLVEKNTAAAEAAALVRGRLRDFRRAQFWRAHAIIDVDSNSKHFVSAVAETIALQRAIAAATAALMQPGMLQSTKGLHYAPPSDPTKTTAALETFSSPYRLDLLARRLLFTLTAERGVGRYTRAVRPLLLSCALPTPVVRAAADADPLAGGRAGEAGARIRAEVATDSHADDGAPSGEEAEFIVVLAHEGSTDAGLVPSPAVGQFLECISDEEEFAQPPQQLFTQRDWVSVEGREATTHLAEIMHLRSLERWNPRRTSVARAKAAERLVEDDVDAEADVLGEAVY